MSGKRAKALRRAMAGVGVPLMSGGKRNVKRAWAETPRDERGTFDVVVEVAAARQNDERRVRRWLASLTPEQLKAVKERVANARNPGV